MAWSAVVPRDPVFTDGVLTFDVVYTDDISGAVKIDQHRLTAPQAADWLQQIVRDRIAQLDGLQKQTIVAGPVTPAPAPTPDDPERATFFKELTRTEFVYYLVSLGWVPADHPKVLATKQRILDRIAAYWDQW